MKDKLNLISSNVKSTKPPNLNKNTIKEVKPKNCPYNKNQQSALFTFSLCWLPVDRMIHPVLPTASQHKCMTYTNCYVYSVVPPDDEQ